jgi:hypothetical protein
VTRDGVSRRRRVSKCPAASPWAGPGQSAPCLPVSGPAPGSSAARRPRALPDLDFACSVAAAAACHAATRSGFFWTRCTQWFICAVQAGHRARRGLRPRRQLCQWSQGPTPPSSARALPRRARRLGACQVAPNQAARQLFEHGADGGSGWSVQPRRRLSPAGSGPAGCGVVQVTGAVRTGERRHRRLRVPWLDEGHGPRLGGGARTRT